MPRFLIRIPIFVFLATLLVSAGCAYHAGVGDRQLPGGYRTIAVPMFKNNTHEVGIETYFTNSMVTEVERMKVGRITSRKEAQVTLLGTIVSVDYVPGSTIVGPTNNIPGGAKLNLQYRIVLNVKMKLVRNSDDKNLWEGAFTRETTYNTPQVGISSLTGIDAIYNNSAHYQYIESMATDLMAEAHDRLTENF